MFPRLEFYLAKNPLAGQLKTLVIMPKCEWEELKSYEPSKFHPTYEQYTSEAYLNFDPASRHANLTMHKIAVSDEEDLIVKRQCVEADVNFVRWVNGV